MGVSHRHRLISLVGGGCVVAAVAASARSSVEAGEKRAFREGEKNVYRVFDTPQRENPRRGHLPPGDYADVNLVDDECNVSSDGQGEATCDLAALDTAARNGVDEMFTNEDEEEEEDEDDPEFKDAVVKIKADVRMFSGCKDNQTSADVFDVAKFGLPDAEGAGGACTNAILVNLRDNKADTLRSLLKGMRATLRENRFMQGGGGTHKALLIGINYTGMRGELRGCHNDVEAMGEYIGEHGYPTKVGRYLRIIADDGIHEAPYKHAILEGIDWLVQGAQAGDSLFMHYSGHGGSVRDRTGDEWDWNDETIIPKDFRRKGIIKDDQIYARLVLPLPAGVTLTVVMDCCHSGSILDLPYAFDATDNDLHALDSGRKPVVRRKSQFNPRKARRAHKLKKR